MELTYISAYITFPGYPEGGSDKPVAFADKVRFERNGYWIEASIHPYFLPSCPSLSKDPVVQKEIIQPTIEMVSADLKTIDDLLPRLQQLANKGEVIASLNYQKKSQPVERFMVFDYALPTDTLFKRLLGFKGVAPDQVKQQYAEFPELAEHVLRGEYGRYACVEGNNLKEAVHTAWLIYAMAERIRQLPEKAC